MRIIVNCMYLLVLIITLFMYNKITHFVHEFKDCVFPRWFFFATGMGSGQQRWSTMMVNGNGQRPQWQRSLVNGSGGQRQCSTAVGNRSGGRWPWKEHLHVFSHWLADHLSWSITYHHCKFCFIIATVFFAGYCCDCMGRLYPPCIPLDWFTSVSSQHHWLICRQWFAMMVSASW